MNDLKAPAPNLKQASISSRWPGISPPQRPKSITNFFSASTFLSRNALIVTVEGSESGCSSAVVTPPAAAAALEHSNVSRRGVPCPPCRCGSIAPGMT
ncbi:MAG: hypothetical protein BWY62_00577 [Firmicutes bacterium ADurb.Bin356]|nr:MAG: hypothetical protein BWY62_00577 [Firmicutes bacterium ADurb.Bin356]